MLSGVRLVTARQSPVWPYLGDDGEPPHSQGSTGRSPRLWYVPTRAFGPTLSPDRLAKSSTANPSATGPRPVRIPTLPTSQEPSDFLGFDCHLRVRSSVNSSAQRRGRVRTGSRNDDGSLDLVVANQLSNAVCTPLGNVVVVPIPILACGNAPAIVSISADRCLRMR